MFTGIIREMGRVKAARPSRAGLELEIGTKIRVPEGSSVAVSGVCLSARPVPRALRFDVVHETLSKTTLGDLRPGDLVNLERSLRHGDEVGGHFVTGHVDGTGRIVRVTRRSEVTIRPPVALARLVAPLGSIAVDGVSLTVAKISRGSFTVALVPITLRKTTLGLKKKNDIVNIETDRRPPKAASGVTMEFLRRAGFRP